MALLTGKAVIMLDTDVKGNAQNKNGNSAKEALTAERLSYAIRNIPDYSRLDGSGFLRDVWKSFAEDVTEIWKRTFKAPATRKTTHPTP
jgi:hypothetical protein